MGALYPLRIFKPRRYASELLTRGSLHEEPLRIRLLDGCIAQGRPISGTRSASGVSQEISQAPAMVAFLQRPTGSLLDAYRGIVDILILQVHVSHIQPLSLILNRRFIQATTGRT